MTADAEAWCIQVAAQRRPRPLEGRTVAEALEIARDVADVTTPITKRSYCCGRLPSP